MSKKKKIKRLESEQELIAERMSRKHEGTCKDCEYNMFRGVVLFCRKYNVPMLYEASCPDFYPIKTYAKQKEVEIND